MHQVHPHAGLLSGIVFNKLLWLEKYVNLPTKKNKKINKA